MARRISTQMWIRYLLAGVLGFAGSKVLPDTGSWLADVTAVILGY